MPKSRPISDDELLAAIRAAEEQALGAVSGTIASDRADATDRYLGKPYGDEVDGRSKVVSRDVADVVEGVVANVIKPFVSGDEVVRFDPRGQDDEEQAQQETDYINFIALERNNGFTVLNSAIKDAMLLRNGYIKTQWLVRSDVLTEMYQGQTDEELALLRQDEDVEILQHSEYPDPAAAMLAAHGINGGPPGMNAGTPPAPGALPPMLHDVKVRRSRPTEFVSTEPVPPDEILVSQRSRSPSLRDADFVQHRVHVTLSELRQMGYKVDDDLMDDDRGQTQEETSRQRFGQDLDSWDEPTSDPSRRLVLFKESYMRIDRDGDGVAELRRICQVGETLLADEDCDDIPFACFTGTLMPHQHLGVSIYDMVKDVAQIKTVLLRQYLDNKYLSNNTRIAVNEDVNIDDVLTNRPGGAIRVRNNADPMKSVFPIISPDTGKSALEGLEYLDSVRENRTGYTKQSAGLDSDAIDRDGWQKMQMQLSQSQLRLEMVARTLAETGVRDLFRLIHSLTLKHSTRAEKVRLRNKWVVVNPREWARRTDLSINVGLGTATTQQLVSNIMMLGQAQEKVLPLQLASRTNIYNLLKKLPPSMGFKNSEEFFTPPAKGPDGKELPMPPQPDPHVQIEQMKQHGNMQKLQQEGAIKVQELKLEDSIKQRELASAQAVQQSNDERDAAKEQIKYSLDSKRLMIEMQQRDLEHIREQQTQIQVANIKAAAQVAAAEISANASNAAADSAALLKAEEKDAGYDMAGMIERQGKMLEAMHGALTQLAAPKKVIRGPDGKVMGVASATPTVN